jgi:hypothetical protein
MIFKSYNRRIEDGRVLAVNVCIGGMGPSVVADGPVVLHDIKAVKVFKQVADNVWNQIAEVSNRLHECLFDHFICQFICQKIEDG